MYYKVRTVTLRVVVAADGYGYVGPDPADLVQALLDAFPDEVVSTGVTHIGSPRDATEDECEQMCWDAEDVGDAVGGDE